MKGCIYLVTRANEMAREDGNNLDKKWDAIMENGD
jgi:RNAse (barnase) inhibitor barstar